MTAASDLLQHARNVFTTSTREPVNTLSVAVDNSATAWTMGLTIGATDAIQAGALLECGLETVFVTAVSGQTLTVIRGFNRTTAVNHSQNALVRVNPRLYDGQLLGAMNDELGALSAPANGLYRVLTLDITSTSETTLDLGGADPIFDVLQIRRITSNGVIHERNWKWWTGMPTAAAPSGRGVVLYQSRATGTFQVIAKSRFGQLTGQNQDVETVTGMRTEALDILWRGAVLRIAAGRDIAAGLHEAAPVHTVEPNRQQQAMSLLRAQYAQRVAEEAQRLAAEYPKVR